MNDRTYAAANAQDWIEISDIARLPEKPLVSVVMLAYNHGPYLAEAIEGVLMQQTNFRVELLIGEDCSKDNTREIALHYQQEHPDLIRVITSDRNVGLHENCRRILEVSRGEFVAFCEGDDYWIDPTKLSRQVSIFRSDHRVTIVHADHVRREDFWGRSFHTSPSGRFSDMHDKQKLSGDLSEQFFGALYTHTSTVMVRMQPIRQYLQTTLASLAGGFIDRCLLNFCATTGIVAYIDAPMSAYRVWAGSITRSSLATATTLWKWQLEYFENFESQFGLYLKTSLTIRKSFCKGIARNAFRLGDRATFETYRTTLLEMPLSLREYLWTQCLSIGTRIPRLGTATAAVADVAARSKNFVRRVKILGGLISSIRLTDAEVKAS
jgi:glycosyltransferase involved in cell wall biosynthesis